MRYRNGPLEVDAIKSTDVIKLFIASVQLPRWIAEAFGEGSLLPQPAGVTVLDSFGDWLFAANETDDWIIRHDDGSIHIVSGRQFAQTFEKVD